MRHRVRWGAAGAALFLAGLPLTAAPAAPVSMATAALAPSVEAFWEMNEPANSTVMEDSGSGGLDATVDQAGLDTGYTFADATGYFWPYRAPDTPPASPERVIKVPDNARLDPGGDTFSVEIRYRTTQKFGNILQKGQSASVGGQWKFQNPQGRPSCLFKSSTGQAGVRSPAALNDGAWHTLSCVREPARVTMYVDGVRVARKVGSSGTIDNKVAMTIGGKSNCDQITTTCDYFSGAIDYVLITRGI